MAKSRLGRNYRTNYDWFLQANSGSGGREGEEPIHIVKIFVYIYMYVFF